MLPQFPEFKMLEMSDWTDVEKITKQYKPYSDFNFISMYSWDVDTEMQISELNGNLVVKFSDYITAEPFYSFLGKNKTTETSLALLDLSEKEGIQLSLKMVPEISLSEIDQSIFKIDEDRDHFDYILGLEKLSDFKASSMNDHASFSRRFVEAHGDVITIKTLDLQDPSHRAEVTALTTVWMKNKAEQNKSFLDHLEDAVKRYLLITKDNYHESFVSVGIFREDKLIAMTINEMVDEDYSICHFMKGDNAFKGIYSHLVTSTCQEVLKNGRKFINFEQDLGMKNLRQAKKTYEPVDFLKKYTLSKI
jgi:uncharacterized protein